MKLVNIHAAKTHLSRLIDEAARGEPFIIARSGKPMVKVMPLDSELAPRRTGFMAGEILVPADFDTMGQDEIDKLFGLCS